MLGLVDGSVRRQVKDDIATAQNLCFFFWDWNLKIVFLEKQDQRQETECARKKQVEYLNSKQ